MIAVIIVILILIVLIVFINYLYKEHIENRMYRIAVDMNLRRKANKVNRDISRRKKR